MLMLDSERQDPVPLPAPPERPPSLVWSEGCFGSTTWGVLSGVEGDGVLSEPVLEAEVVCVSVQSSAALARGPPACHRKSVHES